jgi:DNA-binding PadR family transcriptional regulator
MTLSVALQNEPPKRYQARPSISQSRPVTRIYPALKRPEAKGWIASGWETSEHNRRAKYYKLTAAGRKQLAPEHSKWADFVKAVGLIMGTLPEVKG